MWSKIKTIVSTCLVFLAGIFGFIGGIFFYGKYMDKPETQVINDNDIEIGKIKSKGDGNQTDVSFPKPEENNNLVIPKKKILETRRLQRRKLKKV